MLRSILLLMVYFSFIGAGLAAPFIATLGYVWLDLFQPQTMSYVMFLNAFPVAMIMGIVAVATYVMMDRRSPPPLTPGSLTTTAAPCRAHSSAIARPTPRPAPVTATTFPSSIPIRGSP